MGRHAAPHSRARLRRRLLSPVVTLIAVGALALQGVPAYAATIQTDLWIYQFGDTVNVTGDGFAPTETVELVTTDPLGTVVDDGTTVADDAGTIAYSFVLAGTEPGIYDVVATGQSSGTIAATQFDPGPPDTAFDSAHSLPADPSNVANPAFWFVGSSGTPPYTFKCNLDLADDGTPAHKLVWTTCVSGDHIGPLAEGSHTFQVSAVDSNSKDDNSPASYTWYVDLTAPTTSITANPTNPSNSSSASFSFSGTDNHTTTANLTYQCQIDSGTWTSCTSAKSYTSLSDGSHSFGVRATDGAGNTDATPATYTWTISTDSVAPETTIDSQPSDPSNNSSPSFSFSGTDNVTAASDLTFECKLDAGTYATCTSPKSLSALSDGSHTFYVRAIDSAHNTDATPASFTWTVDTVAPTTSIDSGPSSPTNSTSATFSYSGTDNVTAATSLTFECRRDSSLPGDWAACPAGGAFSSLGGGSHTLEVRARDAAGNVDATPASYTWVVDTAAPDTSITAKPADPSAVTSPTFSFTGSDLVTATSDLTFECSLDGAVFSTCTSGLSVTVAQGSHTFDVRAVDEAGNRDTTPATYTWFVDLTAPDTVIGTTVPSPTNATSESISFSGSDNHSLASALTFECKLDGGSWETCTSPGALSSLTEGSHTFQVRATDEADNTDASPDSITWYVDLTPPDTSIDSSPSDPTNSAGGSVTFSGTDDHSLAANLTFECNLDGDGWVACTSPRTLAGLIEGTHTFEVRATDPADNTDLTPATVTWLVDLTPPTTVISGKPDNPSNVASPSFGFAATDNYSAASDISYQCKLDSDAYASCSSSLSVGPLNEGSHTFYVKATDKADNEETAKSYTWYVDLTRPDTSIDTKPTDPSNNAGPTFAFSGTDNHSLSSALTFMCQLDGGAYSACTSPDVLSGLSDGSHTFSVYAVDEAGNADATPASHTWVVDTTAPVVTLTAPAAGSSTDDTTPTLSGTAGVVTGDGSTVTIKIYEGTSVGGTLNQTRTASVNATTGAFSVDATALSPGKYTARAQQSDSATNIGYSTASTFTVRAPTSLLYTGQQIVVIPNPFTLAATLSSSGSPCSAVGQSVTFTFDRDPVTGAAGATLVKTVTTIAGGLASSSQSTSGWQPGTYDITVGFAGTADCRDATYEASLTVGDSGDAANGGGWYTLSGVGRINFGFTTRKVPGTGTETVPAQYKGQLLLINNGKWRLKGGNITGYVKTSAGNGSVSGTGTLQWWDQTLAGGTGDWAVAKSGVNFTATFYDSGSGGKNSSDKFGINVQYSPVSPQPSTMPNTSPQLLKGGDVKVG